MEYCFRIELAVVLDNGDCIYDQTSIQTVNKKRGEIMKLNVKAFALSCGIFWGAIMLIMTALALTVGYGASFVNAVLSIYLLGTVKTSTLVLGPIMAFIDGAIGGLLFALLYNKLAKK